ncbi:hypothetical protein CANCADRAFT_45137 [Tortispora caseinolytica NRRL Y-17796]|uniref:Uncharacterized protein n=1 Tax=Tortispora caseinolytica NRRL Y-17796 TaxID=767744 RepID=A0A1E4TA31_9ASCO|nr:hypothetical protein CANCADRAFT_45137 [Tortispora caseinolytica NRRL Y-17796]
MASETLWTVLLSTLLGVTSMELIAFIVLAYVRRAGQLVTIFALFAFAAGISAVCCAIAYSVKETKNYSLLWAYIGLTSETIVLVYIALFQFLILFQQRVHGQSWTALWPGSHIGVSLLGNNYQLSSKVSWIFNWAIAAVNTLMATGASTLPGASYTLIDSIRRKQHLSRSLLLASYALMICLALIIVLIFLSEWSNVVRIGVDSQYMTILLICEGIIILQCITSIMALTIPTFDIASISVLTAPMTTGIALWQFIAVWGCLVVEYGQFVYLLWIWNNYEEYEDNKIPADPTTLHEEVSM